MKKKSNKALSIILFLCIAVFLVAVLYLGSLFMDYRKSNKEYAAISKDVLLEVPMETEEEEEDPYSVDWVALEEINPDVVAWIRFPNLDISYPILQGRDNDEYLRTTINKTPASAGSIFLDAACSPDFTDDNTVIYGHNMRNLSMFGRLKTLYRDEAVLRENEYFYIYTREARYKCHIFALGNAKVADERFQFVSGTTEQKEAYIQFCMESNTYEMPVTAEVTDRLVTLSTCVATGNKAYRLQVHAVLEEY